MLRNYIKRCLLIFNIATVTIFAKKLLQFQSIHQNTAIEGPEPWFDGQVSHKDFCFHKCVKNYTHCFYVQYKEIDATTWLCKLFALITDLSNHLVISEGEMLARSFHPNDYSGIDCQTHHDFGHKTSGVYNITHNGKTMTVYCHMFPDGGWIAIQRRVNFEDLSFNQNWEVYKDGFGDPASNHWIGNGNIHYLTTGRNMDIMFIATAYDWSEINARYEGFFIEDETTNYKVHSGTYKEGTSADYKADWLDHDGMEFSTPDRDNDLYSGGKCAQYKEGGWWFKSCSEISFNNDHRNNQPEWDSWSKSSTISRTLMLIRENRN
ncbi:angiopoietin-related protein 2-like [Clytia hemisphaerica]|uniref:Fibrinogen C-terminal domain-containing protein n=1 Tax=Clytia hemisphaerica TaxID=252671 RepID=A0A7M5X7B5_9CNID